MSWRVALALTRPELRRSLRSLVAIGVLAGLTAGFALGAVAFAQRTTSAPDRLAAATNLDDARVQLYAANELENKVATLPSVESAWIAKNSVGEIEGSGREQAGKQFVSISSGPVRPDGLFTPVVIDGRLPSDDAAHEIAVTEPLAAALGMSAGDVLNLRMLEAAEVFQFDTGFGRPDGPLLDLTVTGVVRISSKGGNGFGPAFGTPAFDLRYGHLSPGPTVLLRLKERAAGRDALQRELAALLEREASTSEEANEFGPISADFPVEEMSPQVATAKRVLGGGLLLFAAVVLLAGLLATTQALGRLAAGRADDLRTERALGLVRAERVLGRLIPASVMIAIAVALAVAGVLVAGLFEPLGGLGAFEPQLGWLPNLRVAVWGSLATALVLVVVVVVSTLRAERAEDPRRGVAARVLPTALGRHAPVVAGTSFALTGRRTTLVGTALGIAGIVATAVFAASLQRLEHEPARYGWTADFGIADIKDDELARVAADPRVRDIQVTWSETTGLVGGSVVGIESREDRLGSLPSTVLEGRLPVRVDEVALGPRRLEQLGLRVGDQVAAGPDGAPFTITGVALATPMFNRQLGYEAILTREGLEALRQSPAYLTAFVRVHDGVDPAEVTATYADDYEIFAREAPAVVTNLRDLGALPVVLELFLALLVVAALVHALLDVTRRRARDLGVLRALGLTPRQVAEALVAMSGGVVAIGLLVGVPLGLAVGRLTWAEAAASIGVAGDAVVPVGLLVAFVPAAAVVALLVAVVPAHRAGRRAPAALLRDE